MQYKLLMENWRKFLKEEEAVVGAGDTDVVTGADDNINTDQEQVTNFTYKPGQKPVWVKTGSSLKLFDVDLERIDRERANLYNLADYMIRQAAEKVGIPSFRKEEEITVQDVKKLQTALNLKYKDGDFGPGTLAGISLYLFYRKQTNESNETNLLAAAKNLGTKYIDEIASPATLKTAYVRLNRKFNNQITPPARMNTKEGPKYESWKEDEEFLRKSERLAEEFGLSLTELLALFGIETAGTFSSRVENKYGYTGLIQIGTVEGGLKSTRRNAAATMIAVDRQRLKGTKNKIPRLKRGQTNREAVLDAWEKYGTKKYDFKNMTRVEQLEYVRAYFEMSGVNNLKPDRLRAARVYCSILWPAGKNLAPNKAVLAERLELLDDKKYIQKGKELGWYESVPRAYRANIGAFKGIKMKRAGVITILDFDSKIKDVIKQYGLDKIQL